MNPHSKTRGDFFDLPRQKKDSTVSLSENDANSPTRNIPTSVPTNAANNPASNAIVSGNDKVLDFDKKEEDRTSQDEEDFFDPLEYPVKKRSLSNGDSFFPTQVAEQVAAV